MNRSEFLIEKMDCPAEEQLVRMALQDVRQVESLAFDLRKRRLGVVHTGEVEEIRQKIDALRLGASLLSSGIGEDASGGQVSSSEATLLKRVLAINLFFFLLEVVTGFVAGSMGLVADSLDMLADSVVYGLALYVTGRELVHKKRVAALSGALQLMLALGGLYEIARRFLGAEGIPSYPLMIGISALALVGNAACLILLKRGRNREVHMQASMIFTSNDVIANIGVIAAGVLVMWTGSQVPDLLVGIAIFVLVGRGAVRIFRLSR
jgi:cobalt-zinc-cadmium efflux system protein